MHKLYVWVISITLLGFTHCRKQALEPDQDDLPKLNVAQTANGSNLMNSNLSYGDTVFYLKNQPGDYTILPISKPVGSGYFKSNPTDLSIDSVTGRVNITKSETGLRYKIYYLSPSGQRMDSVKLIISGIDYADGIYELKSTPVAYDTAFPIYNAMPGLLLPCTPGDDDDDGDSDDDDLGCVFDETDLNNDGNDDIPGVIQDKLLVDIKQGTIDLEASFHAGVFGSNPANGVTKDFTFYYRLNDFSNRALNKITVRLYHFKKRSDIPQGLLDEIKNKNNLSVAVNNSVARSTSSVARDSRQSIAYSSSSESEESSESVESKPKRPPLIVIVSQN